MAGPMASPATPSARVRRPLHQAAAAYADSFSAAETRHLISQFRAMDDDESGACTRGEIAECFRRAGKQISAEEIDLLIAAVDDDGSGEIEIGEWFAISLQIRDGQPQALGSSDTSLGWHPSTQRS